VDGSRVQSSEQATGWLEWDLMTFTERPQLFAGDSDLLSLSKPFLEIGISEKGNQHCFLVSRKS
jgi:hypothetical protein